MSANMALAAKKIALEGRKYVHRAREAVREAEADPSRKSEMEAKAREYLANARLLREQAAKLLSK